MYACIMITKCGKLKGAKRLFKSVMEQLDISFLYQHILKINKTTQIRRKAVNVILVNAACFFAS